MFQYHPSDPGLRPTDQPMTYACMENPGGSMTLSSPAEGPYNNNNFEKWCQHQMNVVPNTKKVPSSWPQGPGAGNNVAMLRPHPQHMQVDVSGSSVYVPRVKYRRSGHHHPPPPPPPNNNNSMRSDTEPAFSELGSMLSVVGGAELDFQESYFPAMKNVWQWNLIEEFAAIRQLLTKYRFVAMDTEFPGVVIRNPRGGPPVIGTSLEGNQLEIIRQNVDVLKLIQLGISFFDEDGNSPPGTSTWQFNFKFNLKSDRWAETSIDLLQEAGMQFERHESDGIDPEDFCYLFLSSGLILEEDIVWLTYHGGYDFGYLMRILRGQNLPTDPDFSEFMKTYFPTCYDLKVLLAGHPTFMGGLHDISQRLGLCRIGIPHQAGSDSLLTGKTFFKIKEKFFDNPTEEYNLEMFNGKIYGLGYKQDFIQANMICFQEEEECYQQESEETSIQQEYVPPDADDDDDNKNSSDHESFTSCNNYDGDDAVFLDNDPEESCETEPLASPAI